MIVINSSTRQFNIPGADLTFGVEADSGSEIKHFQCPRYVGNNLDIAGSFVRINYRNANGEIDSYLVNDVAVDGDNVTFSWELSHKVTDYKGQIRFVMCVVGPDTKVKWHTTLGVGQVLEGLEPDSAMIEEGTADVVAQLIAMVDKQTVAVENKGAEWVRNVQSEGTDQVIAVQTAAQEAQAASVAQIEAKGVNTRESIPEDYTALSEAVDTLNRTRGAAIVCEAAGETVVVSDASDLPMQGLRVFGKTTQVKTTGAQLADFENRDDSNGVTSTFNNDTLVITGDGSLTYQYTRTSITDFVKNNPGKTLRFSYESIVSTNTLDGHVAQINLAFADGTPKYVAILSKTLAQTPYTIPEDTSSITSASLSIYTTNNATAQANKITIVKPMLHFGTESVEYESYSNGVASPSLDFPQELVSLEPVVEVCGKNLTYSHVTRETNFSGVGIKVTLDKSEVTVNGTAEKLHSYGIVRTRVLPVGKYTVSVYGLNVTNASTDRVYVMDNEIEKVLCNNVQDGKPKTFEMTKPGMVRVDVVFGEGSTYENRTVKVQIEKGEVATEYESYKVARTLELTHTLPGIPVASGGNYTDSDGQQWICDEVDLGRGVYVQRVGKATYTGDSNEYVSTYGTKDSGFAVSRKSNDYMLPTASDQVMPAFCDKLTAVSTADIYSLAPNGTFAFSTGGNVIRFSLDVLSGFTVDEVRSWLSENPLTFMYMLATPIETALSETEIAAYRALHSNYPNTTVLNDSGAHMVVKYAADTKLYIDNKITALIGG